MSNPFFDHPILNSPYSIPTRHWELDEHGQPTQKTIDLRRRADFITPIPKPKKRKRSAVQDDFVFDDGKGGLTDILYQRDGDYSIGDVPSRWDIGGSKVCGAGGRYPSDECGLTVL